MRRILGGAAVLGRSPARPRGTRFRAFAPIAVLALVLAGPLASCGRDATSACGPDRREALDQNLGHVLPGAPPPTYLTDPPTSGPHQPGKALHGVQAAELSPPLQVGLLEAGSILLQYRATKVTGADLVRLEGLGGDDVVIAPNAGLGDPVVATAWVHKQACSSVDTASLQRFIDAHVGQGADSGGATG